MCISKDKFPEIRYFYTDCPFIASNEEFLTLWLNCSYAEKSVQQKHWDINYFQTRIESQGAVPVVQYFTRHDS